MEYRAAVVLDSHTSDAGAVVFTTEETFRYASEAVEVAETFESWLPTVNPHAIPAEWADDGYTVDDVDLYAEEAIVRWRCRECNYRTWSNDEDDRECPICGERLYTEEG